MLNINQTTKFLLALMLSFMLAACSSSSSNTSLSGVAATGAAIDGFVFVTDANGTEVNVATDPVTGEYTIDVTGMTPPFILKVVPNGGGATLFSFAGSSNQNINITPLTDLAMFIANGSADVAAAYNAWTGTQVASAAIQTAQAVINANLTTQLTAAGLDPTTLDIFSNTFSTNGSGFDGVLDGIAVAVDTTGGTFTFTVTGASGFSFDTGIDTSGITIPGTGGGTGSSAGGLSNGDATVGANEALATIPADIAGTYELTFTETNSGSGITDTSTATFIVSTDGTLTIDGTTVLGTPVFRNGNGAEAIWKDTVNNREYALSALQSFGIASSTFNEINVGAPDGASFYGQYRNAAPLPQLAGTLAITGAGATDFGVTELSPALGNRIVSSPTTTYSWFQTGNPSFSISVSSSDTGPSPISAVSISKTVTLTSSSGSTDSWSLLGTTLADLVGVSIDESALTVTFTNVTLAGQGANGDIILNGTFTYRNL